MTDLSDPHLQTAPRPEAQFGDYVRLLKPRVMSLVIFTAMAGMLAAPVAVHPVEAFAALLCIAVGAGASGALNMWWDADIDAAMARTRARPIPTGLVEPGEALSLGLGLSVLSVVMLGLFANPLAAGLLAFTIFFYAVIYSMWLKRATPQNIVIGGAAGAFPPMIAWAAVTGEVSATAVMMFLIIFLWTPPHFWALALFRRGDYAGVGVPMLPVVAGDRATRRQIGGYAVAMVPAALLPAVMTGGGPVYLAVALWATWRFLRPAHIVATRREAEALADGHAAEKRLFGASIEWLFAIFGGFVLQALVTALTGWPDWWPRLV